MSILNRDSDGLYSVLVAIYKLIISQGPLERERLISLCAPKSLVPWPKDNKGEDTYSILQVNKTLIRWGQLGLFQDLHGEISLNKNINKDDRTLNRLSFIARERLMDQENNERFWENEDSGASDLTRSLAWCLAQDVYDFEYSSWDDAKKLIDFQVSKDFAPIFQNDTRWASLRDWIPFLGFGYFSKKARLIIDPTPAVRDALPEIFRKSSTLEGHHFLSQLAKVLPVVDGGEYRRQVEDRLRKTTGPNAWQPLPSGQISTSLSRAVMGLISSGVLQCETASDSGSRSGSSVRMILTGRNRRILENYSHVTWTLNR